MAAEHTAVPETLQPLIPSSQSISFKISDSVPEWTDQITFRGLVVSALLGTVFCILVHRLSLATGIIPSANIAAALVSFFVVKIWTGFISKFGFSNTPFTRQENTIIQTCIVACYGLAASGGFGTYLLAMDEKIYELTGVDYPGNRSEDVKNPGLGWMGFLLPFISKQSGYWYSACLHDSDLKGLGGYKVIMSVSLILGDGLYNLIKTVTITLKKVHNSPRQDGIPVSNEESSRQLVEQNGRNDIFLKDRIPSWFAACGFMIVTIISAMTIPIIFPQLKWYVVLISCAIAPIFAFCNSYGTGLTDMSMLSTYGKIGIFIIASLVGRNGGVISGLAACGAIVTSAATAADLMQDFRTAYLTLSSPKAMFIGQLAGTTMGCVIAPLTFWLFWTAFDVGSPNGPYPAPYAILFRQMAILGISGFSELPKYSLVIFCSLLVLALIMNVLRDVLPLKLSRYIPIPMAMAIPVFVGANFAIDMFIGTALSFFWERRNQKDADDYVGAVASGLICGDGLWTIPSAILSISRINPPVCMNFRPSLRR